MSKVRNWQWNLNLNIDSSWKSSDGYFCGLVRSIILTEQIWLKLWHHEFSTGAKATLKKRWKINVYD